MSGEHEKSRPTASERAVDAAWDVGKNVASAAAIYLGAVLVGLVKAYPTGVVLSAYVVMSFGTAAAVIILRPKIRNTKDIKLAKRLEMTAATMSVVGTLLTMGYLAFAVFNRN